MRVLPDECVDQRLLILFVGHHCQTAGYAKLSGLKNGVLLAAAGSAGFEVSITTKHEIPYRQNLSLRRISILILSAPTNRLPDLELQVTSALQAWDAITPGRSHTNGLTQFSQVIHPPCPFSQSI